MKYVYIIVYLRDRTMEVSRPYDEQELASWHESLETRIANWDGLTYNPSGACWYCPRCAVCPGLQTQIGATHQMLADAGDIEAALAAMTPQQKLDLWEKIGLGQKLFDHARNLIKLEAVASDGALVGETKQLVINQIVKKPLDSLKAWPVLKSYLSDAELAPAVKISKTTALDAIKAKAPKGQGAKLIRKVTEELEVADAFVETVELRAQIRPLGTAEEKQIEGD